MKFYFKNLIFLFLATAAAISLSGCVATVTDIDRLQDSLTQVQKSQAALLGKLNDLDSRMNMLNERLDENQKKMGTLSVKLDDVQVQLGTKIETISGILTSTASASRPQVPSEVYRTAYADYLAGKTALAIEEFTNFMQQYPNSVLKDDAQFYMADSYLQLNNYNQARVEFDKVLASSLSFRAAALLKRAQALAGTNKAQDQKNTLETLIKEFPQSPEAQSAQQILDQLRKK